MKTLLLLALIVTNIFAFNYAQTQQAQYFASKMHSKYGFSKQYILNTLSQAKHLQSVLERYNGVRKHATDFSWHRYKSKILIADSISLGKNFMRKNAKYLKKAKQRYGINKEIITGFIRVESKFGMFGGEYSVLNALTTLAFNRNRKQRFFKEQLEKMFVLARREHLNPINLRGSFAGAMGCVQQVPSIYLKYGVDLDRDGRANPNSMADCIGSIAKFLHHQGWSNNLPTIVKARVSGNAFRSLKSGYRSRYTLNSLANFGITPKEPFYGNSAYYIRLYDKGAYDIYLGDRNYRIITRYNASKAYATIIALYAKAMRQWR